MLKNNISFPFLYEGGGVLSSKGVKTYNGDSPKTSQDYLHTQSCKCSAILDTNSSGFLVVWSWLRLNQLLLCQPWPGLGTSLEAAPWSPML